MSEYSTPARPVPDHVVLIGMMGAGKTTVGALVAERLGRPHVDTDAQVCAAAGRRIEEIFAAEGEAVFRAEEARVVEAALASESPAVISVGGGAVLDPSTRWLLGRGGPVVWLRADPATLAMRLGGPSGAGLVEPGIAERPLLAAATPGQSLADVLRRIDETRRPIYAGLADLSVDVDDRDPAQVAEAVLTGLGVRMRPR
jgi:shikimate kinase